MSDARNIKMSKNIPPRIEKYIYTKVMKHGSTQGENEEIRLNSKPWKMANFTNWAERVGKCTKKKYRKEYVCN